MEVLRTEPSVVIDLLVQAELPLPPGTISAAVDDADVSQAVPAHRAADLVVILRASSGLIALVVVIEVQRQVDREKRFAWPIYVAQLAARHRAPVALLVLAQAVRVRRWASQPIAIGPGASLQPFDVDPASLTPDSSAAPVELTVLATLAAVAELQQARGPRRSPHEQAALEERVRSGVLAALQALDPVKRRTHLSLIHGAARPPLRARLDELLEGYDMRALELIRTEGREEGRREGLQEGLSKGAAQALLRVLARRGFVIDAALAARIQGATDPDRLGLWIERAVVASSIEEVFGSDG